MKPKATKNSAKKSKPSSQNSERKESASGTVTPLQWTPQLVKLAQLKPYERNPRTISKTAFDHLVKSLKEDGYHQRIIASPDLSVVGGHQRIEALKKLKVKEIEVLVANRDLSEDEFKRLLIRDNLSYGEFDMDILSADYEREELVEIGMPESLLPGAPDFNATGEGEQGKLDEANEKEPIEVKCPNCQHIFEMGAK